MATKIVEAFSISHAAILNGSTGLEETWGDIYGVREGSLAPDTDSYDNTGDDAVLSTWFWFNYATVTISAGYIPFDLVQGLTGTSISSTGSAPNDQYSIALWDENYLNTPRRPMLIRCPAKDSAGVVRILDIILYNVQFEPMSFDGPAYKGGLVVSYNGRALLSTVNEAGVTLATRAIGRLLNKPG
jgi:hypothetical protein